jgi:hypothetical protein
MMPGYKNLSFTRLGGRRQTFCPKKTIHFIFCVSIFSTQNLFDDHHRTDRAQPSAGQRNLPQGFQLAIVGK